MSWLVHHEFGLDHRPFCFEDSLNQQYSPNEYNYWLQLWVKVYTYVKKHLPQQARLISYDRLCNNTTLVWEQLCDLVNVSSMTDGDTS